MTKVAILPEPSKKGQIMYRAIANGHKSVAKTAGEALDALTAQLSPAETSTIIVIQNQSPGELFTAQQQERLAELMARWRTARDTGKSLSVAEQTELEALVDAELAAAGNRAAAVLATARE